ncbi:MAG TPA: MucB/RseB C-terminal domain-containing protein [Arenicellales bacterium]|nr:MucB/RseB C-terminal domain-containing protein [Arenicellales bacterium]
MKPTLIWVMLLLGTPCAAVAQDGADWLMKINDAARELNYDGTFVYVEGYRIASMRVTHRARGGAMRQRIYSLNGAAREVIRDDNQVWCYVPDRKLGVHEYRRVSRKGFPDLLPKGLEHLVRYYDVRVGEQGRVADRRVQQIVVEPRDGFRYGYDLWADEASGLLLKAALLNEERQPIEQYLFTTIEIGADIDPENLEPVTPKSDLVWYGDARSEDDVSGISRRDSEMAAANWVAEEVPDGFSLTRKMRRKSPMSGAVVEHYVYSDGLASVSVFIEKLDDADARISGTKKMGAVYAFGREVDGHQVTVVGEVPARTVDLIGMSVRPKKQ